MKKIYKIILIIACVCLTLAYGVYWAFFDLQRIVGQEVLQEITSPSGDDTIVVYLNNDGATTSYAILCTVKDNQTGRERNIYWQDHRDEANVQWVDDDTVIINGVELDVWEESYDFRNARDRSLDENDKTIHDISEGSYQAQGGSKETTIKFDLEEKTFVMNFEVTSSVIIIGNFEVEENQIIAISESGSERYVFDIVDEETISFVEKESTRNERWKDGTKFVFHK